MDIKNSDISVSVMITNRLKMEAEPSLETSRT